MSNFHSDMRQFTGSAVLYHHPLYKVPQYTEGIRYFLQNAGNGAYWLLDLIATEPAIAKQAREFASIKLSVKHNAARLWVDDGNLGKPVYERTIEYTDCPEGQYSFYWTDNVLMLASEY